MFKKKRKEWKDLTPLQQKTLAEFNKFHVEDEVLSYIMRGWMEEHGDLCYHAVTSLNPHFIYGWRICKSCLMQLFKIRRNLVKKDKLNANIANQRRSEEETTETSFEEKNIRNQKGETQCIG